MTDYGEKDLEESEQIFKEERFEVPEDKPWRQLIYFTTVWISRYNGHCISQNLPSLYLRHFDGWSFTLRYGVFFIIVLVMFASHCFFALISCMIWIKNNTSTAAPGSWRCSPRETWGFGAGLLSKWTKQKPQHDLFSNSSECRKLFVRLIIKPIKLQTYQVWYPRNIFFQQMKILALIRRTNCWYREQGRRGRARCCYGCHFPSTELIVLCVIEFLAIAVLYSIKGPPWEQTERSSIECLLHELMHFMES